ncbi:hypothetical protein GCM10028783_43180 [Modestobacter muralis]
MRRRRTPTRAHGIAVGPELSEPSRTFPGMEPHEESKYLGAMAPVYAAAATECVRHLKSCTAQANGLHDTLDASIAIRSVGDLLQDLPTAVRQIRVWLEGEATQGRVSVEGGPYAGHPDEAIGVLNAYLSTVCGVLDQAATGLRAAEVIAETLAATDVGGAEQVDGDTSTDVDPPVAAPGGSVLPFPQGASRSRALPAGHC